jgi:D-alanyl-D-alanine carboxypeptidase
MASPLSLLGRGSLVVRASLVGLAFALAQLVGQAYVPVTAAASVASCSFGDTPAPNAAYSLYASTIVDTRFRLRSTYAPPLVSVTRAGFSGGGSVRPEVIPDLAAMRAAAAAAGAPIAVRSAYRSYATQVTTFRQWVAQGGYAMALRTSARPGHSEHQLGTALDFQTAGGPAPWGPGADWARTPSGAWMRANAWRFGFLMSYPKGAASRTCYDYEPWHYRYVGRAEAKAVHDSGLTLREWLFRHTNVVIPTAPHPPPTPRPTPHATIARTPTPSRSKIPSATPVWYPRVA